MKRVARLSVLTGVLVFLVATTAAALPGESASAAPKSACTELYGGHGQGDSWTATEPLQRSYYDGNGATTTNNCFRLKVDKHTNLQDHERITVSWSGAHVTAGRSLNPYGESGLSQEYPVVLMECRGVDPKNFKNGTVPSGHES